MLDLLHIDQSDICLMHQGRGIQRLACRLLRHFLGREPPQFVIDQRQELFGGVYVTCLDRAKDSRDVAHVRSACLKAGLTTVVSYRPRVEYAHTHSGFSDLSGANLAGASLKEAVSSSC